MEKYFEMRTYLDIYAPMIIMSIISILGGIYLVYVAIKEKIEKKRREKEK